MTDFSINGSGNSQNIVVDDTQPAIGDETLTTSHVQSSTHSGGGESPIGADAAPTEYDLAEPANQNQDPNNTEYNLAEPANQNQVPNNNGEMQPIPAE
jgi:hypothetical protein